MFNDLYACKVLQFESVHLKNTVLHYLLLSLLQHETKTLLNQDVT